MTTQEEYDKECADDLAYLAALEMSQDSAMPDTLIVTHDNAVERCPECGSGDLIGEYETDADGNVIVDVAYCRCGWLRNVR